MTTDEALDFCKRFDDPKLQACMGTDFSRATGTVGALLALRAELDRLQSILDADPVSKLEAMGVTGLNVARDGDLTMVANVEGEHYEVPVQLASSGKVSEDIRDAATRLLARVRGGTGWLTI